MQKLSGLPKTLPCMTPYVAVYIAILQHSRPPKTDQSCKWIKFQNLFCIVFAENNEKYIKSYTFETYNLFIFMQKLSGLPKTVPCMTPYVAVYIAILQHSRPPKVHQSCKWIKFQRLVCIFFPENNE